MIDHANHASIHPRNTRLSGSILALLDIMIPLLVWHMLVPGIHNINSVIGYTCQTSAGIPLNLPR